MTNCTQNSENTTENTLEDSICAHILETANHAIAMFNERQTSHFYIHCEELLTTLLPLTRILTKVTSADVANQIEKTIDLMQRGEEIAEITKWESRLANKEGYLSYVHSILKCQYGWPAMLPDGMAWEEWDRIIYDGFGNGCSAHGIAEKLAQEFVKSGGKFSERIDGKPNTRSPKLTENMAAA